MTANFCALSRKREIINVPEYPVEHDNDLLNEYGATPIPKNMFVKANGILLFYFTIFEMVN